MSCGSSWIRSILANINFCKRTESEIPEIRSETVLKILEHLLKCDTCFSFALKNDLIINLANSVSGKKLKKCEEDRMEGLKTKLKQIGHKNQQEAVELLREMIQPENIECFFVLTSKAYELITELSRKTRSIDKKPKPRIKIPKPVSLLYLEIMADANKTEKPNPSLQELTSNLTIISKLVTSTLN